MTSRRASAALLLVALLLTACNVRIKVVHVSSEGGKNTYEATLDVPD